MSQYSLHFVGRDEDIRYSDQVLTEIGRPPLTPQLASAAGMMMSTVEHLLANITQQHGIMKLHH